MDGGVDRREWTLQHRKAADISLTPPQADLDSDCLDVNVKGPGEKYLLLNFPDLITFFKNFSNIDFIFSQMASPH